MSKLHVLRSPYARYAMAAALAASMMPAGAEPAIAVDRESLEDVPPPAPPPPPTTQRLRMIDDAGLAYLNAQKAKRRQINAKRARNAERSEAGKRG